MEFNQVRYFLALAETLNFTRAAEKCNVSQPALTRSIKLLEQELNGPLLIRNGKNNCLSELGRELHTSFIELDNARQSLKDLAESVTAGDMATINIGISDTLSHTLLCGFFSEFYSTHSNLSINLFRARPAEMGEMLLNGEFDVCFSADVAAEHTKIKYHTLGRERLVVAFGHNHCFRDKTSVTWPEFFQHSIIMQRNCAYQNTIIARAAKSYPELNISVTTDNCAWVKELVACDAGVTILPETTAIEFDLDYRAIHSNEQVFRKFEISYVYGVPRSAALRVFIQHAKDYDWSVKNRALSGEVEFAHAGHVLNIPCENKAPDKLAVTPQAQPPKESRL